VQKITWAADEKEGHIFFAVCRYEGNPWLGKDVTNGQKPKLGIIIGAVLGALVALRLLAGIFVYFCFFRKHTEKETHQPLNLRAGPSLRGLCN
jgi:hypothetical protein